MTQKLLYSGLLSVLALMLNAQTVTFRGAVRDAETEKPLSDAAVVMTGSGKVAASDRDGNFTLADVECTNCTLSITHEGYEPLTLQLTARDAAVPLQISLSKISDINGQPSDIPTITLEEAELQTDGAGEVANLLTASRDVFQTVAGFGGQLLAMKFSRSDESEADALGLVLAAKAGYRPAAGITLWQKIDRKSVV